MAAQVAAFDELHELESVNGAAHQSKNWDVSPCFVHTVSDIYGIAEW